MMKNKIYCFTSTLSVALFLLFCSCSCTIGSIELEAGKTGIANSAPSTAGNNIATNEISISSNLQAPAFSDKDKLIVILQCASFLILHRADFDIAVIDCDDSSLTKKEITDLQNQGKSIISYLSIGEAETYRSYWQNSWQTGNPQFIEEENPDWPGNFKVKFWVREWQEIIFSELEQIVLRGYDGAYLDVVDTYKYFEQKGYSLSKHYMIEFIKNISAKAKAINPKFLIIPQNAEDLAGNGAILKSIDGLGRENLWFKNNIRVDEEENSSALEDLLYAKENGKFVFAIGYLSTDDLKNEFLSLCSRYGFIPYVGKIELDTIEK